MFIYCIEDINDLKYVGKTKRKLHDRWRRHVSDKYNSKATKCSSSKLNLLNSIIYLLEECEEDLSKEREKYWINKIDCVNIMKLNGRNMENNRKWERERYKRRKLKKGLLN
jgi:hypothetical protein